MHFFDTNGKPHVYVGIAIVSLMILTGLIFAGTAVALTILMPVFVVFSPIIVPAVMVSSVVATGLLASGSLGASAIAVLVWLYKKEERFRYNLHTRGVHAAQEPKGSMPKRLNKANAGNLPGGDKPPGELKPPGSDKPPPVEEIKPPEGDKSSEKDKQSERDKPTEESKPLGGAKHEEEMPSIHEIREVLLEEQKPLGPKSCVPNASTKRSHQIRLGMDSTKARSVFVKEYHKVPRVGTLAFNYFTSRDKKNT